MKNTRKFSDTHIEKLRLAKMGKRDENTNRWKGNNVGYRGLHIWVENNLGKPHICRYCGRKDLRHRQYQWANIDKKYKRNLNDWIRLCVKCHKAFDAGKVH